MTDLEKLRVEVATADLSDDERRVMLGVIRLAEQNELTLNYMINQRNEACKLVEAAEATYCKSTSALALSAALALSSLAFWIWIA